MEGTTASPTPHNTAPSGLATLALLKTYYDERQDHLEMFVPFAIDAIAALSAVDFSTTELRLSLRQRHNLDLPPASIDLLLSRLWKRGYIRREGGHNFVHSLPERSDLFRASKEAQRRHQHLASLLRAYAGARRQDLTTNEEALAAIMNFLESNHLQLILGDGEDEPTDVSPTRRGQSKLVAGFIAHLRESNSPHLIDLQEVLEGYILQNVLLLRDIDFRKKNLAGLEIYFDTGFLFALLGLTGELARAAASETIDLLKATRARLAVFERTLVEMQTILSVYEDRLTTPDGIVQLRPTELTRYLVPNHWTSSDVREASALLRSRLEHLGLVPKPFPTRDPRFTLDESRLQELLKAPGSRDNDIEPRVLHDVDAVAAVLTLRRGRAATSLEEAGAVFATSAGLPLKRIREWYSESGERGVCPAVHIQALSNIAWLKRPRATSSLKLAELVALCASALRPSRPTWTRFTLHLNRMRTEGSLTTDEAVAVVASSLTDRLLSEVEDDLTLDADTISDIVARVKNSYSAAAEHAAERARADAEAEKAAILEALRLKQDEASGEARRARGEMDLRQELERRLRHRSLAIGNAIAWACYSTVTIPLVVGLALSLPGVAPERGWPRIASHACIAVSLLFGLLALFRRDHLHDYRERLAGRIASRVSRWLLPG